MREFDADAFACNFLCDQCSRDFLDLSKVEQTENNFIQLASLALASVFIYFVKSSEYHKQIYYDEKSHPHPLIRLGYLSKIFVENINSQEFGFTFNYEIIYSKTNELAFYLLQMPLNSSPGGVFTA